MHSGRLEIFHIKAYFDFRFYVRQFPFNPGYLTSFSAPKSRDLKIFSFKANFPLIKVRLRQVLLYNRMYIYIYIYNSPKG
jgi:hypothetical protein